MLTSLVTQNCPFPLSGSRLTKRPGDLRDRAKDSRSRSGQKLGSNTHKTISLPKEGETSFVKFVREEGRGIRPGQAEKSASFQKTRQMPTSPRPLSGLVRA